MDHHSAREDELDGARPLQLPKEGGRWRNGDLGNEPLQRLWDDGLTVRFELDLAALPYLFF